MKKATICLIVLFLAFGVAMASVKCPIHDYGSTYWTGNTKYVDGKQLKEYNCSAGHTFWVVS